MGNGSSKQKQVLDDRALEEETTLGELLQRFQESLTAELTADTATLILNSLRTAVRRGDRYRLSVEGRANALAKLDELQAAVRRMHDAEVVRAAAADLQRRLELVRATLSGLRRTERALYDKWAKSLTKDRKNQNGVPIEVAEREYSVRTEVRELNSKIDTLAVLEADLAGVRNQSPELQLEHLDAQGFLSAFARAQAGEDPFPMHPLLASAVNTLRASLPGLSDETWDREVRELRRAQPDINSILRAPLAYAAEEAVFAAHEFTERESGIVPTNEIVKEVQKVFPEGGLRTEMETMVAVMDRGGTAHGTRIRSRAPRVALLANKAGFNLQDQKVRAFIGDIGVAWVSATKESDSGGQNKTTIRGELRL